MRQQAVSKMTHLCFTTVILRQLISCYDLGELYTFKKILKNTLKTHQRKKNHAAHLY